METERLEYRVVLDDGRGGEVLGRLRDLDAAAAVYMGAVAKYPKANIWLRHGSRTVREHRGDRPEEPPDPSLPDWAVQIIRGSRLELRGYVMAPDEASAIEAAVRDFNLSPEQRKRLAVTLRPGQRLIR